jgi:hypothetical protein
MKLSPKAKQLNVPIDNLILDLNNPRFAELYNGSSNEDDLIEYLLYTEAAEDLAFAILKAGEFYPDKPLWVVKKDDKFLVKDGNRRCSAVKALQLPGKYKLSLAKTVILELPVLLYENEVDIDERILEEHAGNLFRKWERIAKALEVLKLADSGKFEEAKDLDSKPDDLIKLASFYKEAVKHGGDDLRQLLRRGRGKTGGKTIIFERLFRDSKLCGYHFKNSPSFRVDVKDSTKFSSYILALISYLKANPSITTQIIDNDKNFIFKLNVFGFEANINTGLHVDKHLVNVGSGNSSSNYNEITENTTNSIDIITDPVQIPVNDSSSTALNNNSLVTGGKNSTNSNISSRGSVKKYPDIKRKKMPPGLNNRIKEYFEIDPITQPNAKIAMARITFECVLKYIIENTNFNGKTAMSKSGYFGQVYRKALFADFTLMKTKFTDLILNTGDRSAFSAFDLDKLHVIVHNYKVNGISANAEQISNNLIGLLEFMLKSEADLLSSLDLPKL